MTSLHVLFRILVCTFAFAVTSALPATAQEPFFEIDRLNAGLPAPPDAINRTTPRSAMESLQRVIAREDYAAAAHLFDLSDIDPAQQPEIGARIAEQFAIVLERQVLIPWNDLSDRPDGWIDGSDKEPGTGRVRRSILLTLLEGDDHPIPLRLNRVKPDGADPAWVISAPTVRAIPALYEKFKPTALEQAMPEALRDRGPFGMYYWEWVLLPAVIALAILAGYIAFRLTGWLGSLSSRRFVQSIVRAFRWPATIATVAFVVAFATSRLFVVTGPVSVVIQPLVLLGYIIAAALAAVLVADEVFDRVSLNTPADLADPANAHRRSLATLISGIRKFVIVTAVILGAITLLGSIELFNSVGYTLLAGAGAITIVLGFAAREVLGNLLAAVQIALNRSARIGDLIVFEGQFCTVERIHFTYVQLLVWTGNRYIVPVSEFVSNAFENLSAGDHKMIRPVTVTLHHEADVGALRDAFGDIMDKVDDGTLGDRDKAFVAVTEQDMFGKKVLFALPTPDQSTFWMLECAAREAILDRAAAIARETGKPMLPEIPARDMPGS
ncbi:mechanosensitive ion channel family protein [Roseovarius sp. SCSIO 43702]|uniref:mechanosensitive ion channel family protein n=1 Tax=Roseovarius sp. SCSIO 43702 TaxID=2823043 RepID=UPI001C73590D|nr:mechanosensitive ion channel domain-containing protein [Roseovarius sp. SCSIO 43702]QYX55397.1 mechanosensitive ion channel family protein [Roseovarius sp. SCSIO 43702]